MICEYAAIRTVFGFTRTKLASETYVPENSFWAEEIAKFRIEHDRTRELQIQDGAVLGSPTYVEDDSEIIGGRIGEWRSEIIAPAA